MATGGEIDNGAAVLPVSKKMRLVDYTPLKALPPPRKWDTPGDMKELKRLCKSDDPFDRPAESCFDAIIAETRAVWAARGDGYKKTRRKKTVTEGLPQPTGWLQPLPKKDWSVILANAFPSSTASSSNSAPKKPEPYMVWDD